MLMTIMGMVAVTVMAMMIVIAIWTVHVFVSGRFRGGHGTPGFDLTVGIVVRRPEIWARKAP